MRSEFPHILCVNPWIHDFAAFDFWAKPLGLLSLAAVLRQNGINVSYIDCLDRFHPRETGPVKVLWDGRGPFRKTPIDPPEGLEKTGKSYSRYGIKPQWLIEDLQRMDVPDAIFVTSLMTYWASGVKETIDVIKSVYPKIPLVLGGIYARLNFDHACTYSGADLVIKDRGEPQLKALVKKVTGFDMDNANSTDPSDSLPWPALDLAHKIPYAPILTSRGCPFSCDYCASSFLEPEFEQRAFEDVFNEISHWHTNYQVKNFAFYDDALLMNPEAHLFPLLEKIIDAKMDIWFHTPNALHVRGISEKAARLMFSSGFKTIRLGLETTDFSSTRSHDAKVEKTDFFNAVEQLKNAGFKKSQIGAYLLCGLPGQRLDDVETAVDFVKQQGILPVPAYYTPIPHTTMWEDAVQHAKFDLNQHPVFTNNTLFPCVHAKADLKRISQLKNNLT